MTMRTKTKSLIAMGQTAFEIMNLYHNGLKTSEITKQMKFKKEQNTQGYREELIKSGWMIPTDRGKCQLTEAGKYFLKTIYLNEKVRIKLK